MPSHTLVRHDLPDALEYQRRTPEATVLYRVVQHNLETFLASARDRGRVVPCFVERELRAFLDCGLLCRGFLRVRCDDCGRIQPDHLKVLKAIAEEPRRDVNGIMGSPVQTLSRRLPSIPQDRVEELVAEMNDLRITNLTSLRTMMTPTGAEDLRHAVTPFGQRFRDFLLED